MKADARRARLLKTLRKQGVTDEAVLAAMAAVPRERFVPAALAHRAYQNTALPIGEGQTVSQPLVVGTMTQALGVHPAGTVLEIGTGSGYQTAILAHLCRRVYTIERIAALQRRAMQVLEDLGLRNVVYRVGDGSLGWPEQAPYDRIMVTAAAADVPRALTEQLAAGGAMVVPVGPAGRTQSLLLLRRTAHGIERSELSAVRFVPLVAGETAPPQA